VIRSADRLTPLLDLDPDLGRLLPPERFEEARAAFGVRVSVIRPGAWDCDRLSAAHPEHLAVLIVDGVIAWEVEHDGSRTRHSPPQG
jgi:hypothetical protein